MELLSELVPFLFVLGILVVAGAPVAAIVLGVMLVEARRRIRVLTYRIGILETRLASGTPRPSPSAAAPSVVREPQATAPAATARPRVAPSPTSGRERHLAASARRAAQRPVFLGGHTLVRVGVILLFFGFSFFLSYVAERGWFPIELRLSAAGAAGVALLAVGWRLRESRREYSLALQGCGAGIVYLTAFAAVNYYAVVGAGVGLGVMSVLVALTATLAVRQDAPSLAVLASLGGFLAPVLVTRDAGHVALFSYYAVLDAGIVTIAWFRAWRLLNLLGFVFTFVVGAWWGAAFYRPPYFTTTQPFLALFFALFVTGPVLQARRQPLRLAEYVDRTLVVGVPVTAFFLQYRLVSGFENGPAASALAFCVFYAVVAALLRRLGGEWVRVLTESFAAMSAAFAALAISLAAGGPWVAVTLALEGAAVVWIGVRRHWRPGLAAGLGLQALGGYFAIAGQFGSVSPALNTLYQGYLVVSLSGLFSAWLLSRSDIPNPDSRRLSIVTLGWGSLWWFRAGLYEISLSVPAFDQHPAMLGFFTVSGGACALLRGRLAWKELAYPALILLPAMGVLASLWFSTTSHLLAGWGAVAWPAAFLAQYMLLRRFETEWSGATPWYHCGTLWLGVFLAWQEVLWLSERSLSSTWSYSAAALVPACVVWTLATFGSRLEWPVQRYREVYLGAGLLPLVIGAVAWVLGAGLLAGDPRPLAYVPLLNPVEMAQAISLLALFRWCSTDVVDTSDEFRGRTFGFLGFVVLNGVLARMTHHFLDVPFEVGALLSSEVFQGLLSFVWTTLACITMVAATRAGRRSEWRLGAILLTATVIKLFLFDLAATGTATRVVSFIAVGAFILAIGYFSPSPPPEGGDTGSDGRAADEERQEQKPS